MSINFKEILEDTVGVVEANRFEQLCLWKENKDIWEEKSQSIFVNVGNTDNRPTCVMLTTQIIRGEKILFVDPTSMLVDYNLIHKWLKDNLPSSAFRPTGSMDGDRVVNMVDAMNFYNVFSIGRG